MLRRTPRALGLWVGAAVLTLATGSVVAGDLAALHRRAGSLGPERSAVVATRALPLGTTVGPGDVTTRRIHASQLPPGVLRSPDAAVGRVVRVPVVRAGFVRHAHVAPADRRGLAGALPAGTRVVRIPVEHGLRPPPGSAVDVYASFATGGDVLGTGRSIRPEAVVVAAGAVVLPVDGDTRSTDADGATEDGVTLLVAADDAAALADAAARASLFLALVPPEDARIAVGLTPR